MSYNLESKKIIISAGATGIGWATAKECLEKGAKVFLCDIDQKSINKKKDKVFFISPQIRLLENSKSLNARSTFFPTNDFKIGFNFLVLDLTFLFTDLTKFSLSFITLFLFIYYFFSLVSSSLAFLSAVTQLLRNAGFKSNYPFSVMKTLKTEMPNLGYQVTMN